MVENDLYTVQEVAEVLGLSPQRLYRDIACQRCPSVRFGRNIRITRKQLEHILNHGYTGTY